MEDEVLSWSSEASPRVTPISGITIANTANAVTNRIDDADTRISALEQENSDLKNTINDLESRNWNLERKLTEKTQLYETELYGFMRLVIAVLKEIDTTKFNRTLNTMGELLDNFDYSNSRGYYLDLNGEEVDEDIIE